MRKLFPFCLLALFIVFASNAFADQRVIVHTYSIDDSIQDRSTSGLPGAVSNTWKIVTTGVDTSETYDFGSYATASIVVRVDSINAADSAGFAIIPYVSNDTLTWAPVAESLLVTWGTVIVPSKYRQLFTKVHGAYLRFLVHGRSGNDSCNVFMSLSRQR